MKRNKRKAASAILTADLHLTDIAPISRTDDYITAQGKKLEFLGDLSHYNDDCPILCAGDVFDYWKASPWLSSWVYHKLPNMITIPGNHDLPMHSLEQYDKSALHLLDRVGKLTVLISTALKASYSDFDVIGIPFGRLDKSIKVEGKREGDKRKILLLHKLIWPGRRPKWAKPGQSSTAKEILDDFGDQFDLIVTGDNHRSFTEEQDGCLLVNPGSMMRRTADQADFKPCCYLYFADDNKVIPAYFPIEKGVHDTRHLSSKQERDDRLTAYIERMGREWEQGISFRDRLQMFFDENKTSQHIQTIIWGHLEKGETK